MVCRGYVLGCTRRYYDEYYEFSINTGTSRPSAATAHPRLPIRRAARANRPRVWVIPLTQSVVDPVPTRLMMPHTYKASGLPSLSVTSASSPPAPPDPIVAGLQPASRAKDLPYGSKLPRQPPRTPRAPRSGRCLRAHHQQTATPQLPHLRLQSRTTPVYRKSR